MSYTYAPNGLDVTQVQTALGSILLGYDAQRRPSSYQYFGRAAEQTIYDTLGRKVSWTASNGEARSYSYGADMRLQEVDGAGQVLGKWKYDAKGLVQTYTDGAGMVLQYVYDNLDRLTAVNYPDSGSRQVTYGGCPAVVLSETSRGGAQTLYEYDPARQLVAVTNSARERTQYEHDADGNVTRVVNAAGKTAVRAEYDVMDRRVAEYDGLNQKTSYQYGGFGERAAVMSPTGTSIKYGYNATLDLTSLTPTDGKTAAIGFTYDAYGRPQTMMDGVGTTQYAYNADSTLKTLDGPFVNDTLTYGYDPRGRLQSIQTQGGWLVTYTYDGLGRLESVNAGGEVFQYAYVGASQLVSTLTYPIGVVTTNTYDSVEQLTNTVTVRTEDSVVLAQHEYAYDARDQATTITRTNVLEVAVPEAGKSTAKFDDANQLVEKDGAAYSYDAAGNLIHGPGWDYKYDAFNRLVQAKGKVQVDYAYDGNSMLRQSKKTQIVRHGLLPVQERFATGLPRDLAWGLNLGGGIGGLLTARVGTTRTYYVYDGRGNVVAVLDATGNKVAEYAYDPYGAPAATSGSSDQPYRYSTKMYDADTGLYYFGYRFYSPVLGRWINRDPLGVRGGLNLYAYALNNPLHFIDPNGLEVTNNSDSPVVVKPEDGEWGIVPPHTTWPGSPDGVIGPNGERLAVPGRSWLPDNDVTVDKNGKPTCTGGPCKLLPNKPWPNTKDHPDWVPPRDLKPLSGCK